MRTIMRVGEIGIAFREGTKVDDLMAATEGAKVVNVYISYGKKADYTVAEREYVHFAIVPDSAVEEEKKKEEEEKV